MLPTKIKINQAVVSKTNVGNSIADSIKNDKRIFIVVDGKAMLMTEFLSYVKRLIANSSSQGKPIAGLQRNLEVILDG